MFFKYEDFGLKIFGEFNSNLNIYPFYIIQSKYWDLDSPTQIPPGPN